MIDELHIAGLGVIEDVTIRLAPGLTVVTGETGAGKTMIVTALQLLLGARADSSLVRADRDHAVIEARLRPVPPGAQEWADGDELVVSREIAAEGRSRVRIGGRLATVGALSDALADVVSVQAQHEHVELARPDRQRSLLDRFAGTAHARTLATYRDAYGSWIAARDRLEELRAGARERARELDRLRYEVEEIDAAGLDPGRDSALEAALERLEHAEELVLAAHEGSLALGTDGAGEPLGQAVAALRRLAVDDDEVTALRTRAEGIAAEAAELARDLRSFGESLEADPEHLEELRARQRLLATLRRKYGEDVPGILAYAEEARARVEVLETTGDEVEGLHADVDAFAAAVGELALDVRRGRRLAGGALATAVAGHLAELGMPDATFAVALDAVDAPGPEGADRVTFQLAPNPGDTPRPVGKAVSGGERSRVALAIEVALADVDDAAVLVFDEVDAGVGGATAMAVGEKLARVAAGVRGRQVLCVTHLAQLAAFADVHHVVEKGVAAGRAVTSSREVGADQREAELSRMLSGDPDRSEAREHARALLREAGERRAG